MAIERFINRTDAGRRLALKLLRFTGSDCVVVGVARGGIVVGMEVATHLDVPLDVVVVRKLGYPGSPEYACAAITAAGEIAVFQADNAGVSASWLDAEAKRQMVEAVRRESEYMRFRVPLNIEGKVAIIVDDGIATGLTMMAAILAVRKLNPAKVVVAAPVGASVALRRLAELADEVVTIEEPTSFYAIAQAYVDFTQVKDSEVIACLEAGSRASASL
ncbi:MAG: phosphoribosyltransferase [Fimbriimonadaceae bacterium]